MAHFKNRKPKAWRGCCRMCDRGGGRCESVESKREAAALAEDPTDILLAMECDEMWGVPPY